MPDKKGNLYLFESIELRNEYDHHIKLIENLLGDTQNKKERFFHNSDDERKEPTNEFNRREFEEKLRKIQTKRIKLNQIIQTSNFKTQIVYNGEKISIAEALEIRKNLIAEKDAISQKVLASAYKQIIHKEERDIVHEPKNSFQKMYEEFQDNLRKLRYVINQIHVYNHKTTVNFKDE